ncbi:hypothetical protein Bca4012_021016 [Brassica carinata]|uniref:Uncharacterized protein n=1 Tax=Brassica carinata TaxID=52824 RepID=A0A8X7WGX0_BRACI|nr:hypothetical protein Bca52824_000601 [Brassica carinata]
MRSNQISRSEDSDKSSAKAPEISTSASMAKNPAKSPPKLQLNRPLVPWIRKNSLDDLNASSRDGTAPFHGRRQCGFKKDDNKSLLMLFTKQRLCEEGEIWIEYSRSRKYTEEDAKTVMIQILNVVHVVISEVLYIENSNLRFRVKERHTSGTSSHRNLKKAALTLTSRCFQELESG